MQVQGQYSFLLPEVILDSLLDCYVIAYIIDTRLLFLKEYLLSSLPNNNKLGLWSVPLILIYTQLLCTYCITVHDVIECLVLDRATEQIIQSDS